MAEIGTDMTAVPSVLLGRPRVTLDQRCRTATLLKQVASQPVKRPTPRYLVSRAPIVSFVLGSARGAPIHPRASYWITSDKPAGNEDPGAGRGVDAEIPIRASRRACDPGPRL